MIITVTLNASIDRTLTVPNFQLGQRHRASQGLTLAGGKGINIARALKSLGVPVVASKQGYVTYAGWDVTGYGNRVDVADYLDNPDGNDRTTYGHFSTIGVSYGQWVNQGQWLGNVGCTGNCTGPHLHFEIHWQGEEVDPLLPLP